MTTLPRPRPGAGGQVDARGYTLDCCALEHRLLFSAAPLASTLAESTESVETPLDGLSHQLDAEYNLHAEADELVWKDQIQSEATTHDPVPYLESWIADGAADLEKDLLDLSSGQPIKVSLGHSSLPENGDARVGIDVGVVSPSDLEDHASLVYANTGGEDADSLSLDGSLGDALALREKLDGEVETVNDVQLEVTDAVRLQQTEILHVHTIENNTSFGLFKIHDVDRSLNAIFENAAPGTPVGLTLNASDVNPSGSVRYELIHDAEGRFKVDPSSGVVSVANGILLDRETAPWHTIVVQAIRDDGLRSNDEFLVNVLDINDNPFTFTTSTRIISGENSLVATTITAVDADLPGQSITYTIAGGPDATRFAIDSVTGELRFVSSPDFEAPHDTDRDNVYVVEVSAVDNQGLSVSQAIDISVMNHNELPIAENDFLHAKQDAQLLISAAALLGNDVDRDGDILTIQVVDGPAFGTLVINPDGTMSYQPEEGFEGTDSFTYYTTDGNGVSNVATVEIQVSADSTTSAAKQSAPTRTAKDPATEPDSAADQPSGPATAEMNRYQEESRSAEIQYYLRKRITNVIELIKQAPAEDATVRLDSVVDEPSTRRFEPIMPRTSPRSIATVTHDRYRPIPTNFLDQLDTRALDDQLDHMIDTMSEQQIPDFAVAGATVTTAAMSIGYVVWTTRTGYMMASLLTATPGWKQIDPLPILDFTDVEASGNEGDDRTDINRLLQEQVTKIALRK